ncbi:MAG: hypothetical protein ACHQFZ_02085 [Acidimicrobiales bacterium]
MKKWWVLIPTLGVGLGSSFAGLASASSESSRAESPAALSAFLFRNVSPTFPVSAAQKHTLAVLAVGALPSPIPRGGYDLPFVVRNGTSQTLGTLQGYAMVWSPSGALVTTGSDQGFDPTRLLPGQEAFAYVFLKPLTTTPPGSTVQVTVAGAPLTNLNTFFTDLTVVGVHHVGDQIVGMVRNPRPHTVQGPGGVTVFCVSAAGQFQGEPIWQLPRIPNAGLGAGASAPFTVGLNGASCPSFIVGSSTVDLRYLRN